MNLTGGVVLLTLAASCQAVNLKKREFEYYLGSAKSAKDFAKHIASAIRDQDSSVRQTYVANFLEDLFSACPKDAPDDKYYLYAEDIAMMQETCRLAISSASAAAATCKAKAPKVGRILTPSYLDDYRGTGKMIMAARRVFENAKKVFENSDLVGYRLDTMQKYTTRVEEVIKEAEKWARVNVAVTVAFALYSPAMAAARLYERLLILALVGKEPLDPPKSSSKNAEAKRKQLRKITQSEIRDSISKIQAVVEFPDDHDPFTEWGRQLGQKLASEGSIRLRAIFGVKEEDIRDELANVCDADEELFGNSFAPWLVVPGPFETDDITKLRSDIRAIYKSYLDQPIIKSSNPCGDADDKESRAELRKDTARQISELVRDFIDEHYNTIRRRERRSSHIDVPSTQSEEDGTNEENPTNLLRRSSGTNTTSRSRSEAQMRRRSSIG